MVALFLPLVDQKCATITIVMMTFYYENVDPNEIICVVCKAEKQET